jgi:hypothetical protein
VLTDLSAVSVKIKVMHVLRRNNMFYVEASVEKEAYSLPETLICFVILILIYHRVEMVHKLNTFLCKIPSSGLDKWEK